MATYNMIVKRGTTFYKLFYFKDADLQPVDITDNTYVLTVKKYLYETDAEAQVQRSATVLDGPNGILQVELTEVQSAMPEGEYYYDVQETTLAGEVTIPIDGRLKAQTSANAPG